MLFCTLNDRLLGNDKESFGEGAIISYYNFNTQTGSVFHTDPVLCYSLFSATVYGFRKNRMGHSIAGKNCSPKA